MGRTKGFRPTVKDAYAKLSRDDFATAWHVMADECERRGWPEPTQSKDALRRRIKELEQKNEELQRSLDSKPDQVKVSDDDEINQEKNQPIPLATINHNLYMQGRHDEHQHADSFFRNRLKPFILTGSQLENISARLDELAQIGRGARADVVLARATQLSEDLAKIGRRWKTTAIIIGLDAESMNLTVARISHFQAGIDAVIESQGHNIEPLRAVNSDDPRNISFAEILNGINFGGRRPSDVLDEIGETIYQLKEKGDKSGKKYIWDDYARLARAKLFSDGNIEAVERLDIQKTREGGWPKFASRMHKRWEEKIGG